MKRNIFKQLIVWKQDTRRKPLILMGARQVGKTYILKKFGEFEYDNVVYFNFENSPTLSALFETTMSPQDIIQVLSIEADQDIVPGKTLIIFDEVQECPAAINSLKYFNEEANDYHICAAGSLLGVKLIHRGGFPVGKVNFLHLYPLCFMEFLDALGETRLRGYLENLKSVQPIPENLHEKLLTHFKTYLYVGGLPEAINTFIQLQDYAKVRTVQEEILQAYRLDFAKHAPQDAIMKINQIWTAIPSQLAKENKKFIYSVVRKGARASYFETALQWLTDAGLIHKVSNITTPKLPLEAYAKFDFFKTYLLDVGLLGAMTGLSAKTIIRGEQLFDEFKGAFVENYVAQELVILRQGLYYWTSEGKAEVDFVYHDDDKAYPLEIKSGYSKRKQSLRVYREKYDPALAIRVSPMNLTLDNQLLNCPLYLLGQIKSLLKMI